MNSLLRSMLFIPAYNEKFMQKAVTCEADAIIFDLEDSVPPPREAEARELLCQYLQRENYGSKQLYMRVNEWGTDSLTQDLKVLKTRKLNGLVIPKVDTAADVLNFANAIEEHELLYGIPQGTIKLLPLIETAAAVLNSNDIAGCSERVTALLFGGEDYLDSVWGEHLEPPDALSVPRALVVMAARAHGLLPIDTPYLDLNNQEGFLCEENKAAAMGFAGIMLVTPKQITWAHQCFSPDAEEVEHAKAVMKAIAETDEAGGSIAKIDGKMIGPPMRKRASKVLEIMHMIEKKG